jgi:hypothetical protein
MNDQQMNGEILENLEVVLQKREGDLARAILALDSAAERVTGHLAHYLKKRSYQKAWILLQGGDPEKGVCG